MVYYSNIRQLTILTGSILKKPIYTDPIFNYNSLLIRGTSVSNGNNYNFLDEGVYLSSVTPNGNVTQGSFNPFGPNYSVELGGGVSSPQKYTNTFVQIESASFGFGYNDFSIEMFIKLSVDQTSAGKHIFNGSASYGMDFSIGGDGNSNDLCWLGGSRFANTSISASVDLTGGAWHHIAYSRKNSTGSLFLDGELLISSGDLVNYTLSVNYAYSQCNIGAGTYLSEAFIGSVSNFRVVNYALYTSSFNVPTKKLENISGSVALLLQDNKLIDNSGNNLVLNLYGTSSICPCTPFQKTVNYDPTYYGGSSYFDGSSSYLSISNPTGSYLGPEDFTVEFWQYPTNNSLNSLDGSYTLIDGIINNWGSYSGKNNLWRIVCRGLDITSNTECTMGEWNHVALVQHSGSINFYVNGILDTGSINVSSSVDLTSSYIGGVPSGNYGRYNGYITGLNIISGSAKYTSSFSIPSTVITSSNNTSLLLNFGNSNILDYATSTNLSLLGPTKTSTSITNFNNTSIFMSGSSGNRSGIITTKKLQIGAQDYTTECWVYPTQYSGTNYLFSNSGSSVFYMYFSGSSLCYSSSTSMVTSSAVILLDQWSHLAISRINYTSSLFVNGQLQNKIIDLNNFSSGTISIGYSPDGLYQHDFFGCIDDVRFSVGECRYTSSFNLPTRKFPLNS